MKKIIALFLVTLMLFSLAACTKTPVPNSGEENAIVSASTENNGAATGSKEGIKSAKDILIVGIPQDPGNMDPNDKSIQMVQCVRKQVFETLFAKDNHTGELIPNLAESWEYEDDCSIIVHLRRGVLFHNGDELKASDVLFSLNRAATVATSAPAVAMIDFDKTCALDDYTVKIVTTEVYVPALAYLEWPLVAIFNQRAYEEANGDFSKCAIGTGAFKFVQYVSGDRIEFERFDDYWGEKAHVKQLIMRIIPEASSRTMELETGGVDIIYEAPASDLERLEANDDIVVYRDLSLNTNYLFIRVDHEPFNDIRVRQAVSYALDRDSAVKAAYNNTGITALGYCSPSVIGFDPDVTPVEYNVEKAKALLAEAGYPDGFKTTFHTDTGAERSALAQILANQLGQIGIECEIVAMEPTAYQAMFADGVHNMILNGLTCTTGEGDKAFRWFHSKQLVGLNFTMWTNEEYDKLIDDASKELDESKRIELYGRAQEILKENYIMVPLFHKEILSAARADVKGFENNISFECPYLNTVYFE